MRSAWLLIAFQLLPAFYTVRGSHYNVQRANTTSCIKTRKLKKLELQWRQAPPCSSWDTGREVPFVLVLLTDGKSLSIFLLVTHGQNVNLSFE